MGHAKCSRNKLYLEHEVVDFRLQEVWVEGRPGQPPVRVTTGQTTKLESILWDGRLTSQLRVVVRARTTAPPPAEAEFQQPSGARTASGQLLTTIHRFETQGRRGRRRTATGIAEQSTVHTFTLEAASWGSQYPTRLSTLAEVGARAITWNTETIVFKHDNVADDEYAVRATGQPGARLAIAQPRERLYCLESC